MTLPEEEVHSGSEATAGQRSSSEKAPAGVEGLLGASKTTHDGLTKRKARLGIL